MWVLYLFVWRTDKLIGAATYRMGMAFCEDPANPKEWLIEQLDLPDVAFDVESIAPITDDILLVIHDYVVEKDM